MSALLGGVGLVFGGLVGGSLGAELFCEGPCESEFIDEEGLAELQGALIFGAAGGVLGYVAGMLLPKTDWQELNVDEIGMTLRPRPDSGLTLTFSARL